MNGKNFITREMSYAIKGTGVILMLIHHLFTFPDSWTTGVEYPALVNYAKWFCNPTNICVFIFAFITGYGYYYVRDKSMTYLVKKTTDFLIQYWSVFALLLMIVILCGKSDVLSIRMLFLECFALNRTVMVFCWYVPFYLLSMFWLTIAAKKDYGVVRIVIWMIIIPVIGGAFLAGICNNSIISGTFRRFSRFFPCVAIGYIYAKYSIFERVFERVASYIHNLLLKRCLYLILAIGSFLIGHYWFASEEFTVFLFNGHPVTLSMYYAVFYTPIFIYAMVHLIQDFSQLRLQQGLETVGRNASYLWFLHCAFFYPCADLLQPILYFPKIPILVILWAVVLLLCLSKIIDVPCRYVINQKNKFLSRLRIVKIDQIKSE